MGGIRTPLFTEIKKMKQLLIALFVILPALAMADFHDEKYDIAVFDQTAVGSLGSEITTGVLAFVYSAGTKTLATLYSDDKRTSLSNPITRSQFASDDMLKFYVAASSVDIVLAHSDGSLGKWTSVAPSTHRLLLDRSGVDKCIIFPFSANDNDEADTGLDLPLMSKVTDIIVETVTADSTETLDVGLLSTETSGDADGLIVSASVSTAALVGTTEVTDGTSEDYVSAARCGALMGLGSTGTDSANDFGQPGCVGHIVSGSNATSISYTGSSGSDTAAGYVYVFFKHLR